VNNQNRDLNDIVYYPLLFLSIAFLFIVIVFKLYFDGVEHKDEFYFIFFTIIALIIFIGYSLYLKMDKIKKNIFRKDQEIVKNNQTLESIIDIQKELLSKNSFDVSINKILKITINIVDAHRVYIFKNYTKDGGVYCSQIVEYVKDGVEAQLNNPKLQDISYEEPFIKRWYEKFLKKESIEGFTEEFPEHEQPTLNAQDIKSILVMPIYYDDKFWGIIGFDNCMSKHIWTDTEKKVLDILSQSMVATLIKENYAVELEKEVKLKVNQLREKDNMLIQQSKMAAMGEMIGNIAHQWRQPLNIIGASVMGLTIRYESNSLTDEYVEKFTQNTEDTLQKMSKTIDDFRNFFRPNKVKESFELNKVIKDTIEFLSDSFKVNNIDIVYKNDKIINIDGFKSELQQVLLNIFNNSKDAIKINNIQRGKIEVATDTRNSNIIISISDNGKGIPLDILDKVFEPYFTTKFKHQGTGLGLYMSKMIIENSMGGEINVSNLEDGAVFDIIIPR